MGRRQATWALATALIISGCLPRALPSPSSPGTGEESDFSASESALPVPTPDPVLTLERRRVRDLEAQLAERDREIAAARRQLADARAHAGGPSPAPGASTTAALASRTGTADTAATAGELAAGDATLDDARRQILVLEGRLQNEIERRQQVEREMSHLLEETSSGPYERAGNAVEAHLREQLASARREIADLRATVAAERGERGDLERRFATLQARAERGGQPESDSDEVAALKARQRRVLAGIQQDLAASREREAQLRDALEQSQGRDGVTLADSVSMLRTENAALQQRLDEEYRENRELAAKLTLAGRVTDLIFKMQSRGTTPAAAVPIPR